MIAILSVCQRRLFLSNLSHILLFSLGNIDNIGKGKFFVMVYYQLKPIRISYKITYLSKTRVQISLIPLKIGTYRIYFAYRNFPINGK
jgi:hypothetical protein